MRHSTRENTALLIFTRTAGNEAKHKNFLPHASYGQNTLLAKELLVKTRKVARGSSLPIFICSDSKQVGETFKERLANAIEATYAKGFDKVIAIGSDTPALKVNHIREASILLNAQDVVLGPSTDGGVYLIGMARQSYNREFFLNLPWLSSQVFDAFSHSAISSNLTLSCLETLQDVDDAEDLLASISTLPFSDSFAQLVDYFLSASPVACPPHIFTAVFLGSDVGLRAPPLA